MTPSQPLSRRTFLRLLPASTAAVVLVACGNRSVALTPEATTTPVPPPATSTPAPPTPTTTPEVPPPAAVARQYLAAWQNGDFDGMYALLTPPTRTAISREAFEARYRDLLATATVDSFETGNVEEVMSGSNAAAFEFGVRYHTPFLGSFDVRPRLQLRRESEGEWLVAWTSATIIPGLSETARLRLVSDVPTRGTIFDRNGEPLATEGALLSLGVVPGWIEDEGALLALLSEITGRPPEELAAVYSGQPADWFIPVVDLSLEQAQQFQGQIDGTAGLALRERGIRSYPHGNLAGHVVGFVSPVTAEDLETLAAEGYTESDVVGKAGFEQWGEEILAGRKGGRLVVVTPDGQETTNLVEVDSVPSRDLHLTLDLNVQRTCEQALGERRGAVVVAEVATGNLLGVASWPRYNPNAFVNPLLSAERQALFERDDQPFIHRAIQGGYPSGSLFKIITMAAGMEVANLPPSDPHVCTGVWTGFGFPMRCWKEEGHGEIDLFRGLEQSCNVVFYETGVALDRTDNAALPAMAARFGIGSPTGVELVENSGLLPTPQWKEEQYGEVWTAGDTVNLAIGQGALQVTPAQMARAVLGVAAGGTLPPLALVDRAEDPSGASPPDPISRAEAGQLGLREDVLATIRDAMRGVTVPPLGTASDVFGEFPIAVAGKTGTAETLPDQEPHAWFASYAPAESPQVVVVAMVEHAGMGSEVAAPVVRQVLESMLGLAPADG